MKKIIYFLIYLIFFFILASCNEKIMYSGMILNEENFNIKDLKTKREVIKKMGHPNYMDPIENKYYFFSEQKNVKNFYNKKITNRKIIVFEFDDNEIIRSTLEFDLNDQKNIKYIDEKTSHELIERGFIEKIFGGVGTAPSTTNY